MYSMLSEMTEFQCLNRKGFLCVSELFRMSKQGDSRQKAEATLDLAELFLEEIHVAVVPGEAFGAPGYARLSFALGDDDLKKV